MENNNQAKLHNYSISEDLSHIKKKSPYLITVAFVLVLYSSYALGSDLPDVQHEGNITYITGGIGSEESIALKSVQNDYNLRVLNADVNGAYAGDTHITIFDKHGNELVNTDAGPLFYANMQTGNYVVEESSDDQEKKQPVAITGNKPVSITFRWKLAM